jgi:3-phosphoshikimate 1-carboxyvinyltransferase
VPSSKSDLHRKLICAALSRTHGEIEYHGELGEDILATIDCLGQLGSRIELGASRLVVDPGEIVSAPRLNCRESGSTLRFLLPVAAALCDEFTISGCGRLPQRPIGTVIELLRKNGCSVVGEALPLSVRGRLRGGSFSLPGDVSSQYLSGLLFSLPLLGGGEIRLTTALKSAAYIDITLRNLSAYGINYTVAPNRYILPPGREYSAPTTQLSAEGDWSNAAFFLCAGAKPGAGLIVKGLQPDSPQGDKALPDILRSMGANIVFTEGEIAVSGGELRAIDLDASEIPDLVPPLAVLMSVARGESRIYGAARLRHKESDRLSSVCAMLSALGGDVRETEDGLIIKGKPALSGGEADSANDHRIAMAASLAAQWCKNSVTIFNADAVRKSYPNFYQDWRKLCHSQ